MQIILFHSRFKQARSISLSGRHLFYLLMVFVVCVTGGAAALDHLMDRNNMVWRLPSLFSAQTAPIEAEEAKKERYVRQNLDAMAVKLGVMQAQLIRLDALGERVQGLAGVKPEAFNFRELPGRGGPEQSSVMPNSKPLVDMESFQRALDAMMRDVEHRSDYLNVVETALMNDKMKSKLLPTSQPVDAAYNASGFGWRLDPFNGRSTFHDGIDFAAPTGTQITAAAGGVVIAAAYHHEYGNLLEIDHGNNIVTRYAHASRLLTKVGDIVKRGQKVATVGSTGRSTGAHLHFEVLVGGTPQNPEKFLSAGLQQSHQAKLAALADK